MVSRKNFGVPSPLQENIIFDHHLSQYALRYPARITQWITSWNAETSVPSASIPGHLKFISHRTSRVTFEKYNQSVIFSLLKISSDLPMPVGKSFTV